MIADLFALAVFAGYLNWLLSPASSQPRTWIF